MTKKLKLLATKPPLAIPEFIEADIIAIQSVARCDASPERQKRALDWIIKKLAGVGEISFDLEDQRVTDFREGKRFAGLVLLHIINTPINDLLSEKDKKPREQPQPKENPS